MKMFPLKIDKNFLEIVPAGVPWKFVEQFKDDIEYQLDSTLEEIAGNGGITPIDLIKCVDLRNIHIKERTAQIGRLWCYLYNAGFVSFHKIEIRNGDDTPIDAKAQFGEAQLKKLEEENARLQGRRVPKKESFLVADNAAPIVHKNTRTGEQVKLPINKDPARLDALIKDIAEQTGGEVEPDSNPPKQVKNCVFPRNCEKCNKMFVIQYNQENLQNPDFVIHEHCEKCRPKK